MRAKLQKIRFLLCFSSIVALLSTLAEAAPANRTPSASPAPSGQTSRPAAAPPGLVPGAALVTLPDSPLVDPVQVRHSAVDQTERSREFVVRATIVAEAGPYAPTLYYRAVGDARYYTLPMLPVPGSLDIYAAAISGIFMQRDVEYYIESYDLQLRGPGLYGSSKLPVRVRVVDAPEQASQVSVRTDPPESTLLVDGAEVGITPWRGPLTPGGHELVVRREGYLESASTLEVPRGRDLDLRLSLTSASEKATFSVTSDPSGATVSIDGQVLGQTPLVAPSPGGTHKLSVVKAGFARSERQVALATERSVEITFNLQKLPPEPALAVTTDPMGAQVEVDGKVLGLTPFLGVVPPGDHTLVLRKEGRRTAQAQITMPAERDLDLRFTLDEARVQTPPAIAVATDPVGADVFIDGLSAGKTPYISLLSAGAHTVRVLAAGHKPYDRTIQMPTDHDLELTLLLVPEPPPPGPSPVTITSTPVGLTIDVDGQVLGVTPVELRLAPGAHTIAARSAGFRTIFERVQVVQGQALAVRLSPERLAEGGVSGEPLLSIRTEPDGAQVTLDGRPVGSTPYQRTIAPGSHSIVVQKEGYRAAEETVDVPADRNYELRLGYSLKALRAGVSLTNAAEARREERSRGSGPVVDLDSVRSAGRSVARKPAAKPALPRAAVTTVQCPPQMVALWRPGPFALGVLGLAAAGSGLAANIYANTLGDDIRAQLQERPTTNITELSQRQDRFQTIAGTLVSTGIVTSLIAAIWGASPSPLVPVQAPATVVRIPSPGTDDTAPPSTPASTSAPRDERPEY